MFSVAENPKLQPGPSLWHPRLWKAETESEEETKKRKANSHPLLISFRSQVLGLVLICMSGILSHCAH